MSHDVEPEARPPSSPSRDRDDRTIEAAATLRATMERFGLAATAMRAPRETLARAGVAPSPIASAPLPRLNVSNVTEAPSAGEPAHEFVAGRELGRGGMGVVRAARQRSLGREVALKTVSSRDAGVVRALVREARIMGGLEHPNVVPVHALGLDDQGQPLLVMKRIEGVSWEELLADPSHPAMQSLRAGHGDTLRAHLEILAQVCRALSFAHSRGVVHRDVKPANVMIGSFGEICLLDWGVALLLDERDAEPAGIVGTPGYIAAEMVHGDPRLVDARTDVYLLGATLYEILAHRMLHDAETPQAALVDALLGDPPPVPPGAPDELVALCLAAVSADRAARPATAESFRASIAQYLATREAEGVTRSAAEALARARAGIERDGAGSPDVFRALVEARFGFDAALRIRASSASAQAGRNECIRLLIEREIAIRSPVAARAALLELPSPPPDLVARIDALERELGDERLAAEALARARREGDTSASVGAWRSLVGGIALIALAFGTLMGLDSARADAEPPIAGMVYGQGALTVFVALVVVAFRRRLFATPASTRIAGFCILWFVEAVSNTALAYALGLPLRVAVIYLSSVGALFAAAGTLTILPDLWPAIVLHALALVGTFLFPRSSLAISITLAELNLGAMLYAVSRHARRTRVAN